MFGKLLGKIIAAPIRIVNIPVKALNAGANWMCGDSARVKDNALDDIADGVEESAKKILD